MTVIRVHATVESDTLHVPELRPLIGKSVEIIVREDITPTTPAKANEAFFALAGEDRVDPDALRELRTASVS